MPTRIVRGLLGAAVVAGTTSAVMVARDGRDDGDEHRPQGRSFQRIASVANYLNNGAGAGGETTVSEIIAASADGMTLVYTDSPRKAIGFIDISDPANPQSTGTLDVAGDPTSVDVLGNGYALVAADTSASFTDRSGSLFVVDLGTRTLVHAIPLGGQPDSLKISPDRKYAAIAIENERNEALCVGGKHDGQEADDDECEAGGGALGVLPQTQHGNPAGYLVVIDLVNPSVPVTWLRHEVSLTGLSHYAPGDPEPEFVDVNSRNEAVVTMQENNHVAIVDLAKRAVIADFSAGAVTLDGVDNDEDGTISMTDTVANVSREPDAAAWIPGRGGRLQIATANEGDLFGGSRGFSIFGRDGSVAFDAGASLEEIAVRHGHYPEDRSENKGTEPEAIEYGRFRGEDYLFVGSERGSFVAVYKMNSMGRPTFVQLLPAPFGPEGLLAIPGRNLLVASGEEDDPPLGVRSTVSIYALRDGAPTYPQIVSSTSRESDDERDGPGRSRSPIGWSAMSGLTSLPDRSDTLLGVWDSAYNESRIFRIDVSRTPAVVADYMTVRGGRGNYDPEGIAVAPDGTIWVASEGDGTDGRQNLLVQVDRHGRVLAEVGLPADVLACRAAEVAGPSPNGAATLGSGFEGVAVLRQVSGDGYRLFVAQQRGWNYTSSPACNALDDDPTDGNHLEPRWTRIWIYDPATRAWSHVSWELAPKPVNASWVGLSEITLAHDNWIVLERDNRTGDFGELKTLVMVDQRAARDGVTAPDKAVFDLLPHLGTSNGWITDKPEGVAVTRDGRLYVVTDNDGVDGWSGETWFLRLGRFWELF